MKWAKRIFVSALGTVGCAGVAGWSVAHRPVDRKINIVFDLDHTLFYATRLKDDSVSQLHSPDFDVTLSTRERYIGWNRPFALTMLKILSHFNNLYVFTAATQEYADAILQQAHRTIPTVHFERKLYRDSCQRGKDLTKLGSGELHRSLLVDDRLENRVHRQHFYHVEPYEGPEHESSRSDVVLLKFLVYMTWKNLVGL